MNSQSREDTVSHSPSNRCPSSGEGRKKTTNASLYPYPGQKVIPWELDIFISIAPLITLRIWKGGIDLNCLIKSDFHIRMPKGNGVDLSTYKRKVLQIVNVASECELTNSNYTELSQLYEKYKGNVWRVRKQ
ncbi:hypothetical protein OPV22_030229 [Ensete ventricosum]|uniref:Uncharacterized protein n=1 Tax=Ensete ventricosum TaxID=4639 RepID=A0AAV8Q381_ENSVE|nr:hypothetical protein OPV22_030229 [Ensete ventricosum]